MYGTALRKIQLPNELGWKQAEGLEVRIEEERGDGQGVEKEKRPSFGRQRYNGIVMVWCSGCGEELGD